MFKAETPLFDNGLTAITMTHFQVKALPTSSD